MMFRHPLRPRLVRPFLATGLLLALLAAACNRTPPEGPLPPLELSVRRGDLDLRALAQAWHRDTTQPPVPLFAQYCDTILYWTQTQSLPPPMRPPNTAVLAREIIRFATDSTTQRLIDSTLLVYPKDYDFAALLQKPLQRLKRDFPDLPIPPVVTYVNNYLEPGQLTMDPGFVSDERIAIGLHYFLGRDFSYPRDLPRYLRRRFVPEYIPVYLLDIYAEAAVAAPDPRRKLTLAERCVREGIRHYFLQQMCRETPDSIRFGYSSEQMAWCERNQDAVYKHLLPQLFSTDAFGYAKLVEEGPFTPGLPEAAPGRIGHYFGWRVVQEYMDAHPEVSLAQLVQSTDYDRIFREAGYKP